MDKSSVAILWSRFGPYHLARLRGAAQAMSNLRVVGVEVASDDRDYAWSVEPGAEGFERLTVFSGQNYHDLTPARIVAGVTAALQGLQPGAVAINGWSVPEARAALTWASRRGVRAILMSESKADDLERTWWKEAVKRIVLRRFDAAIVGGRLQADYLASLGFPTKRTRLGYDAIDNAYFEVGSDATRSDRERVRTTLGLPEFYFFACTRFLQRKNLDGLLRGYARYRANSDDAWGLVIAGSGVEEHSLRRLAHSLGVEDVVKWAGFVQYPELPAYLGLASAFVHPAKSEAWGLVVNEAAASALPLIVARPVGAAAELVCEGETGYLFDPNDDADIARALATVAVASSEARGRIGQNARALASTWGPKRFGSELAALIADAPT